MGDEEIFGGESGSAAVVAAAGRNVAARIRWWYNVNYLIPDNPELVEGGKMAALKLRELVADEAGLEAVRLVMMQSPRYFEKLYDRKPEAEDARELFELVPDGVEGAPAAGGVQRKFVYGFFGTAEAGGMAEAGAEFSAEEVVGIADVVYDYPEKGVSWVGVLLIAEKFQRCGLGSEAWGILEKQILKWPGTDRIRVGIVGTNYEVKNFWVRFGFLPLLEFLPWVTEYVRDQVSVHEKYVPLDPELSPAERAVKKAAASVAARPCPACRVAAGQLELLSAVSSSEFNSSDLRFGCRNCGVEFTCDIGHEYYQKRFKIYLDFQASPGWKSCGRCYYFYLTDESLNKVPALPQISPLNGAELSNEPLPLPSPSSSLSPSSSSPPPSSKISRGRSSLLSELPSRHLSLGKNIEAEDLPSQESSQSESGTELPPPLPAQSASNCPACGYPGPLPDGCPTRDRVSKSELDTCQSCGAVALRRFLYSQLNEFRDGMMGDYTRSTNKFICRCNRCGKFSLLETEESDKFGPRIDIEYKFTVSREVAARIAAAADWMEVLEEPRN